MSARQGLEDVPDLVNDMRRRLCDDYQEVNAPQVLDKSLWETSGHWGWYQENMFAVKSAHAFTHRDDRRPTSAFRAQTDEPPGPCPDIQAWPEVLTATCRSGSRSSATCIATTIGRAAWADAGRGFTQDYVHIFCTEDELEFEFLTINDLMMSVYNDFGFEEVVVKLATRPEKRVGTDQMWDHAEDILKRALARMARADNRIKTGINEGEGTFYGPKFEYTLKDALGANGNAARRRSISTCRSGSAPSTSAATWKRSN